MKKGLRAILVFLMIASIFTNIVMTASAVEIPSSYLDASNFLITDATVSNASQPIFKDGKATFKINLSSGVMVTGALVTVKFDKNVLRIVDAGPVTTLDEEGNKTEVIPGMHTHGFAQNDDSAYTFAYISAHGYNTGNTGKEFAYITFEVIDKNYPVTTVEFIAGNYSSTDTIKEFKDVATIDAGMITSFVADNNAITLKWNEIDGAKEYLVYRKGGDDAKYRLLATVSGVFYKDSENIVTNTTYTYAVRAKSVNGDYGWYVGKSFTYINAVGVVVTNESSGVRIAWDKVDGATGYCVFKRKYGKDEWTTLKNVAGDVLVLTDSEVSTGETYEYSVVAYKGENASARSEAVKISRVATVSKVTLANHADGVKVSWTKVDGAQQYCVYRKIKGEESWTTVATVSNKETSVVDKGATSGTVNYYAVKVYAAETWSSYNQYSFNYLAAPVLKSKSSDLNKGLKLKWNAVPGAAKYRIYKENSEGKFKLIATTTKTDFTDTDVKLGKTYTYTLKAENGKNVSACKKPGWSVKYTLKTPVISSVNGYSTKIKIKWSEVSGAEGYKVYRKAENEKKYTNIAKIKGTTYTDKEAKKGVKYTYTVKAYKGKVTSECKKSSSYTGIILATPKGTVKNTTSGVKISWTKITGAEQYKVYRSQYDVNTGKWTSYKWIKTVDAKELSYVDKKATSGEKYKYKVKAFGINSKGTTKATSEIVYLASTKTTIKNTETGIKVSWTKVQGAEKYRVYRSEYNASTGKWSSFETLNTVSSKTLSYTDKTVKAGGSYKYRVRAIKGKTFSSYKTTGEVVFLNSPELVSCEKNEKTNVLVFKQVKGAKEYEVYRKTLYTDWVLIGKLEGVESTTYKDNDIIENTEYIYTVKAVNGSSSSPFNETGVSC